MGLGTVKRKGFFHILEVVIVAMLIFVMLTQLYSVPKANQPWDAAKLNVMSEDILYSLESRGVNWFNTGSVSGNVTSVLPPTMGYSVSTVQNVRPVMRIGVVCTGQDFIDVSAMLSDFTLNGITRDFSVYPIATDALDLSVGGAHSGYEAIVLCGIPYFRNNGDKVAEVEAYLSRGGGVVEFSDLTEGEVTGSRWYGEVMNLRWVSGSVRTPSARTFFPYMDPDERRYPVQKIFFGIPPSMASFRDFANFGSEAVYPDDGASEKVVVIQDIYYSGEGSSHDGKEVPLSTIDWGVNGSGRVAWMSRAPITGSSPDEESQKKLLKSLVIWAASGKAYQIVEGTVSTGATASMRKVYWSPGGMYEPIRIDLTVGYHY